MRNNLLINKEVSSYLLMTSLVICGLIASLITAPKVMHIGINFPFSNIVFSVLTYPIVDCICELWGKQAARQTLWYALGCQIFVAFIIQFSIYAPHATYWQHQSEYQLILESGVNVVAASLIAFSLSQLLDIIVYQKIKEVSKGKMLWLRSNIATCLGQAIDSIIFVNVVFFSSENKMDILCGSIMVKIILSMAMTPIVYLIVIAVNNYLDSNTLAFKVGKS